MRVRDIIQRDGQRLRVSLAAGERSDKPLIRLCDPDRAIPFAILLDLYAAELLSGFLISARVAAVGELSEERCNGDYPLCMRVRAVGGEVRIELDQLGQRLGLARSLWDRLYTELQLVLAHGRRLGEMVPTIGFTRGAERRGLLH